MSTSDVVILGGKIVLGLAFLVILWGYVRGLRRCPWELFLLFVGMLLQYAAYGSTNYTIVLFLREDCGLSDVQAGTYVGFFSMSLTICSVLVGAVCDAIGVKKTLILGTALVILARLFLPFIDNVYWVTFLGFLPLAVGMGLLLPVLSVGIKHWTTPQNAALGFALFYTLMNVGWACAGLIFDQIRTALGEHAMVAVPGLGFSLSTYQIIFFVGLLIVIPQLIIFLCFRDGVKMTEDRGVIVERKAAGVARGVVAVVRKAGADTVRILAECVVKKPFWIYIFMLSLLVPVRLVFYHFHYTWPTYGIRMFGEGAKVGNMYGVLNPTIIVFLAPLVAVATKNVKSYKMLLVGTLVSVGAVGLAVIPSSIFAPLLDTWFADLVFNRWLEVPADKQVPLYFSLLFFVALFTIGEAIWSPRLMQFTAEIAPGGKEGSYIALSYLPFFLAKIVAGPMSGWLVKAYTPEGQASYPDHYMVWVWIGAMAAITPLGLIAFRFLFRRAEFQDAQAAT